MRRFLSPFALVGLLLAGCAEAQAPEAEERTVQGLLLVERTEGEGEPITSISAKFMRSLASDRAATEALVGAKLSLPGLSECVAEQELARTDAASTRPRAGVELIDVGDVTLRTFERGTFDPVGGRAVLGGRVHEIELVPRAFPDVGDVASGVFYTSSDTTEALPAPATYALGGTGTPSIDAFTLEAVAPPRIADAMVQGQPIDDAVEVVLSPEGELTLAWAPANEGDETQVYVDVRGDAAAYRCSFSDAGGAVLPAKVLDGQREISLSLHRVVERSLVVDLTEQQDRSPVTIRFDFSQLARVKLRPSVSSGS